MKEEEMNKVKIKNTIIRAPNELSNEERIAFHKKHNPDLIRLVNPINCNLCGVEMTYIFEPNNPAPLCDENDTESRCCTKCNEEKVIPARFGMMTKGKSY